MSKVTQPIPLILVSIEDVRPYFYLRYTHICTTIAGFQMLHIRTDRFCLRHNLNGRYPHPHIVLLPRDPHNPHLLQISVPIYRDLGTRVLDYVALTFGIQPEDKVWRLEEDSE